MTKNDKSLLEEAVWASCHEQYLLSFITGVPGGWSQSVLLQVWMHE
jgi:hypothetical protein